MAEPVDNDIADVVIERPHAFTAGDETYFLYPPSLGVMLLQRQCLSRLQLDSDSDLTLQVMLNVHDRREQCALAVAYATCRGKDDVFSASFAGRLREIAAIDDEGLTTLLLWVLSALDNTTKLRGRLGLDRDQQRLSEVMRRKDKGNDLTFGGVSIFGTVIDPACERYGWSYDYAVWGVSYACLTAMLLDKVTPVYLTDDERRRIPARFLGARDRATVINGDDPKNYEQIIKHMNWG